MKKPTIADAAQKVFQRQIVKTVSGEPVSAELAKQVIGVLGSLRGSSFRDDKQGELARFILGDIKNPGDKAQVMQDVVEQYGVFLAPIVDLDTRVIKEDARKIIADVLKVDDSTTNIGPEYELTVQHYIDELNKVEAGQYHYEMRGHELRKLNGPAKPLVDPAPKALEQTEEPVRESAEQIWGRVAKQLTSQQITAAAGAKNPEVAAQKTAKLVSRAITEGVGSPANAARVAQLANKLV